MSIEPITFGSGLEDDPLIPRKSSFENPEFDITAMIDLVFMMNIYFLVTTVLAAMAEIDLPSARHVETTNGSAIVITIVHEPDRAPAGLVFLGDGTKEEPLIDPESQERGVRAHVEEGVRNNLDTVLVKAAKDVPLKIVVRIARAASAVGGTQLKLAVVEKE